MLWVLIRIASVLWVLIRIASAMSTHNIGFYAPNFEKVGSILLSACPFFCPFVRPFQKKFKARVMKFHIWIPHQKIAYPYFFSCPNYLPLPSYAPFKV